MKVGMTSPQPVGSMGSGSNAVVAGVPAPSRDAAPQVAHAVQKVSVPGLIKAAERFNEALRAMGHGHVQLRVHEGTQRITIKVVDDSTKEVLREFPPEKLLDALASIQQTIGLLVDERA